MHIGENHKLLIRKALHPEWNPLFCKHLAEFHGKRIGAASCSEVEIMFQQAVELQSEQPAFGEDSAVLLHVGFETLFQCIRRDHNSLAKQRPAFRSAEIEDICESGEILKRNIILFRSQTVAKPCTVHEQIHIILAADVMNILQLLQRIQSSLFRWKREVYHLWLCQILRLAAFIVSRRARRNLFC